MSFSTTSPRSYPATTTTTTNTTTTTVTGAQTTSATPTIGSRVVGWHAKQFNLEWYKRTDHHKYLSITGLPAVHAAVINNDWEFATEALCPDDIGIPWLPTPSQRKSANDYKTSDSGAWASTLPSKNQSTRLEAIRQMGIDLAGKTTIDEAGCLYGANLLTLCLQKSAPPEFMQPLMTMIAEQLPQYLNLPDASGRTPIYVAVERGYEGQVAMLLAAGASPLAPCNFPSPAQNPKNIKQTGDGWPTMSAYQYALKSGDHKIFSLLIENILKSAAWKNDYPIVKDPLHLEQWASNRTEDEIRALANQCPSLKSFLFNLNDKSGSSLVYRTLTQGKSLNNDVIPLFNKDPKLGAVYAAALSGDAALFLVRLNALIASDKKIYTFPDSKIPADMIKTFLLLCAPEDITTLVEKCGSSRPHIGYLASTSFAVEELSLEKFSTLTKALHSLHIDNALLPAIAATAAIADDRYWSFVVNLPGFEMERDEYYVNPMYKNAAINGNTKAFEFAASLSSKFDKLLAQLKSDPTVRFLSGNQSLVIEILKARSLLWFEKCIAAGLDIQSLIDSDDGEVLPLMADLSPDRLGTWLKGKTVNITQQTIDDTRTPEGRDALLKLIKSEKSEPAKTNS